MEQKLKEMIKSDFEKYMRFALTSTRFGFDVFGEYAVSVLNFYIGSNILTFSNKLEGAIYLVELYNVGLGGVMSNDDMKELAQVFAHDPTLDYSIIKPIFD
ncbi:hypothetical protein LZQ00_04880 [Sphingobacterium sp. SRCM116780]|uniref:hypothetical protein n=1 Tax=Sphingobacterium sp. SRCM116780 TaxID=2907623 RepID=UPI001F1C23D7|nr:hypothetical protein [Sphingobacterium sp. SRCM116780]UIR57150.1 hypothetical protein LZQ00_04880 [Sphingobacterium sp. SRCM116780]